LAVSPEPLSGHDVNESAAGLAGVLHVLRELVHLTGAWLMLEPRLEVKCALADHLHDDARAVTDLRRRLEDLRRPADDAGGPADEAAALLDRAAQATSAPGYVAIAYDELKPALVAGLQAQLDALDPLVEEPSLRLLTELLHRQERHVIELGSGGAPPQPTADPSLTRAKAGAPRPLEVLPALADPSRDAYVDIAATEGGAPGAAEGDPARRLHDLVNASICAAELMARTSHEQPGLPWEFHADAARMVWDHLRHAQVHERLMTTELGCRWGDHPVGLAEFRALSAREPAARLAGLYGIDDQLAEQRHTHRREALGRHGREHVDAALDHLLADDLRHADLARAWGVFLLAGDEAAYRRLA
jgi:hypothetical protein